MPGRNLTRRSWMSAPFFLFLGSQAISSAGSIFQFIAATFLLVNITGTGLSAAFNVICGPVSSLLFSSFAGILGDRCSSRHMLSILELLKGLVTVLLVGSHNVLAIYALLFILFSVNTFYGPPGRKLAASILPSEKLVKGNSCLSGISGLSSILGPLIGGALINVHGLDAAFYISSLFSIISSFLLLFIRMPSPTQDLSKRKTSMNGGFYRETAEGLGYFANNHAIKQIVFAGLFISIGSAATNVAFYPFVFNVLRLSADEWNLILSCFYGTSIAAMPITLMADRKIRKAGIKFIYLLFIMISCAWLIYGLSMNFYTILFALVIEGTAMSIIGVLLGSNLQFFTSKPFIARIIGINDFLSNVGKLFGISFAYIAIHLCTPEIVFLLCFASTAFFSLTRLAKGKTGMGNGDLPIIHYSKEI